MTNPFATTGYVGEEYFCDRKKETSTIIELLQNGNDIALVSPRRYGKTDLIRHCFNQGCIKENYYTFIIDIYSTQSLAELTDRLGKAILDTLKSRSAKALSLFIDTVSSMKAGITFDAAGIPSWTLSIGDIRNSSASLDEIFQYIGKADKPCLIAIDEFQQITNYDDKNVEASLRTYIQYCKNANFIFSGSQRDMMGSMFTSSARPFYQSATIIDLPPIDEDRYQEFCQSHFEKAGKHLSPDVVPELYKQTDGTTFYLQKVMNIMFAKTETGQTCKVQDIDSAMAYIIDFSATTYEDMLYRIPERQKQVLLAVAKDGKAKNITSGAFARKHSLSSPSSVNSAVKGLLEKGLLTSSRGTYQVYDLFFRLWITMRYLA